METGVPLADSYRRYKNGTNTIAKWFVRAARACGIHVKSTKSSGTTNRYLMKTSHFVDLAHSIAHQGDLTIGVDSALLATLREVIQLRTAANDFFEKHSYGESQEQSNATHSHFIAVLREVLEVLEPLVASATSWVLPAKSAARVDDSQATVPRPTVASVDDSPDDDTNDGLEQSSAHMPLRQQASQRSRARKKSKPHTKRKDKPLPPSEEFEMETTVDDLYLTLFCFFKDLNEARTYINAVWKQYAAGETTLIAASVTTDLAMGAVQRKENEFLATEVFMDGKLFTLDEVFKNLQAKRIRSEFSRFWRYSDGFKLNHWYLGELLFDHIYQLGEQQTSRDHEARKVFDTTMYALADWLGLPSFAWLDYVRMYMTTGQDEKPCPNPIVDVQDQSSMEGARLANRFSSNLETVILFESLFKCSRIHRHDLTYLPPLDLWTKEMLIMISSIFKEGQKKKEKSRPTLSAQRHLTTAFVWSTTVTLDISESIGSMGDNAFSELKDHAQMAVATERNYHKWCKQHKSYGSSEKRYRLHKITVFNERYIMQERPDRGAARCPEDRERFRTDLHTVLSMSPVWCGVLLFWIKLTLFVTFIEIVNSIQIAVTCIHTYNMAKNGCGIDMNWPDLEYVIKLHGEEHLFYGGRPTDLKKCESRLQMTIGVSPSDLARGVPAAEFGRLNRRRDLRKDVLVSHLLASKYSMRLRATETQLAPGGFQASDPASLLLSVARRSHPSLEASQDNACASLVELLQNLQVVLDHDWEHLQFDYFELVRQACAACNCLMDSLKHDPEAVLKMAEKNENTLLYELFIEICNKVEASDGRRGSKGTHKLLAHLAEFTKQHGSDILDESRRRAERPHGCCCCRCRCRRKYIKPSDSETRPGASDSDRDAPAQTCSKDENAVKKDPKNKSKKKSRKTRSKAADAESALSLESVQEALPTVKKESDQSVPVYQQLGFFP